jgi:BirA family transcriptional regulator, biotin operon repressor / biotin---[acetyl-CoA-carboxylase] ligase
MEPLFIGKNVIFLSQVYSTNSHAIELLKNVNPPEGTVIHASSQTHGKGLRGNTWESLPASNLTASVILKPTFLDIKNSYYLYQICALAVQNTIMEILDSSQFDIKIKWPNDILVNGKKISGILIENNIQNNQIKWCVAGIGINVNQDKFLNLHNACSLKSLTRKSPDINHVLKLTCIHLERYYLALKNGKYDLIRTDYLNNLYGRNSFLNFEYEGKVLSLKVKGISEGGLLLLEDDEGKEIQADVKEIKWRY